MVFQSSLDLWVVVILLIISLIGLLRGFLSEVASISNWFGSLYLTSLAKPFLANLLRNKISTPFLLDIVSNVILFVFCMIVLSIVNSYLTTEIEKFLPVHVNRTFGFLFGLIKGFLISVIILASLDILYRDPNIEEPNWLKDSIAFSYFNDASGNIFVGILERILGDMIKEGSGEKKLEHSEENGKNINPKEI
ncbi:MAG: CvpA family protein, partial [Rickettsiales bacterium]|nr:CvpA family protein [Rickettsiales bacterium]